jgi:3-dehydroquinate synthase
MTRIPVALGERSYDILIEQDLLSRAGEHLLPYARGNRLVVVTDEHVWAAQGERLRTGLGAIAVEPILVAPGEASKSWPVLAELCDRLLALGVERRDHIVAFGGGVVGDLAGFAAAILNRGCGLVQIPTSLLAQVDSSVGGKTAINVAAGKNLVGAFHQPALVLVDPNGLDTLDRRQLLAGYAEVVKYALIDDLQFFEWLDANGPRLLAGDADARAHAIATCVAAKARIVSADERETTGQRALLNLGHSFGHALEAEVGYSDRLLHGEAVAIGMTLAFAFSAERGLCTPEDAARVRDHLARAGLPVSLRDARLDAPASRLISHMMLDKKKREGRLTLILASGIGRAFVESSVEPAEVEAFLARFT